MINIDPSTPFGARVLDRLKREPLAWLTTTGADGTPHPKPVWFLWDDETILVFSRPGTAKLRHIVRSPRVSFNFDGDGRGGDIIVITGTAAIESACPPADHLPAYVDKYHAGFLRIGMTAETFATAYSVAIRITPEKLSGH